MGWTDGEGLWQGSGWQLLCNYKSGMRFEGCKILSAGALVQQHGSSRSGSAPVGRSSAVTSSAAPSLVGLCLHIILITEILPPHFFYHLFVCFILRFNLLWRLNACVMGLWISYWLYSFWQLVSNGSARVLATWPLSEKRERLYPGFLCEKTLASLEIHLEFSKASSSSLETPTWDWLIHQNLIVPTTGSVLMDVGIMSDLALPLPCPVSASWGVSAGFPTWCRSRAELGCSLHVGDRGMRTGWDLTVGKKGTLSSQSQKAVQNGQISNSSK